MTNAPDNSSLPSAAVMACEAGRPWSYDEAARFLGVCATTVARACRDQRIKSVTLGRRRLIPDDELRRVAREGFSPTPYRLEATRPAAAGHTGSRVEGDDHA